MIIVSGSTNNIEYYSRYNTINYYEILDHWSRIVFSGNTNITAINGIVYHTGITYEFIDNNIYTYNSYYIENDIKYLANQSMLQSYNEYVVNNRFTIPTKEKRIFNSNNISATNINYVDNDYIVYDYVE